MPHLDIKTALSQIWLQLFDEMQARTVGAIAGDIEELHKFRVALRKTRALVKLFHPYLSKLDAFDDDWRWLADVSGPVRDLDVLLQSTERLPAQLDVAAAAMVPLIRPLQREHKAARRALQRALRSKRWRDFGTRWRLFVVDTLPKLDAPALQTQARTLARVVLLQQCIALLRAAKKLNRNLSAPVLHKLRIRGKRIRYLLATLAPYVDADWGDANWGGALPKRLTQLQDILGAYQDSIAMQATLQRIETQLTTRQADAVLPRWRALLEHDRAVACVQFSDALANFIEACGDIA